MSFTPQALGDLGEEKFQHWAKLAGQETTSPGNDRKGWDRYVEWRLTNEERTGPPASLREDDREVKALVQIKTTSGSPGSYAISLPNCRSLIEHKGPSFLAVLEVSEREMAIDVEDVYIIHLWREHISSYTERMVERERVETPVDEFTPFHKATLTVPYRDATPLDSPYPQALRTALSDPVRYSPDRYVEEKIRLRRRVGYPNGKRQFVLRVTSEVPEEYKGNAAGHFADTLLGRADLHDPKLEMADVRFGYQTSLERLPAGTELHAKVEKQQARLRFVNEQPFGREYADSHMQDATITDVAGTQVTGGKIRFTFPRVEEPPGPLGEMTLTYVEEGFRYHFGFDLPGEARLPLNKMQKVLSVAFFMIETFEAGEALTISEKPPGGEWNEIITLRDEQSASGSFACELRTLEGDSVRAVVGCASDLAHEADVPEDVPVKLAELRSYETILSLFSSLKTLYEGGEVSQALYFVMEREDLQSEIEKAFEGQTTALASFSALRLGSRVITFAFAAAGRFSKMCETADSEVDATSETAMAEDTVWVEGDEEEMEEARGLLQQLSEGQVAYKIEVDATDCLDCRAFDSAEEVPPPEVLLAEAEKTMEAKYERTLLMKEDGLAVSFTDRLSSAEAASYSS